MGAIAFAGPGAVVGARERFQAVLHVAEAARIEERLARDAARAPVLLHAFRRGDAELAIELLVGKAAQRVLVEDRNAAPFVRILQSIEPHILETGPPERRAHRLLDRDALALHLDATDL